LVATALVLFLATVFFAGCFLSASPVRERESADADAFSWVFGEDCLGMGSGSGVAGAVRIEQPTP
jgi:hypothetical protein